jgi:ankyrin repeat protein
MKKLLEARDLAGMRALLRENGADPELTAAWPPARAIVVAAFTGVSEYVAILRTRRVERNVFVSSALGDARAVARYLKKDPSSATARDAGVLTALQCAAGSKLGARDARTAAALLECASLLIAAGADVNAVTRSWSHNVTATYFAVHHDAMYRLLLDHGADPTAALPPAVWRERYHLAELALERGADINAPVDDGKPILNQLIRWGQMKQAFWLLERGASPNVADERGWTAVHQAASRGNERIMRAVLAAGGDRSRRDGAGHTPLQAARSMGRSRMATILGA